MHLASFTAKNFRRFADLKIDGIPSSARFVVLAGPNGTGKSSLFDAFLTWEDSNGSIRGFFDRDYQLRTDDPEAKNFVFFRKNLRAEFHEALGRRPSKEDWIFYTRTAHRYAGRFQVHTLDRAKGLEPYKGPSSMIDQQSSVQGNFQKIISRALSAAFKSNDDETKIKDWRKSFLGSLQISVRCLFPELELVDEQDPLEVGTFLFRRNGGMPFPYMNLSGGEKAAFDLILDLIAHESELNDKIVLIDEPEVHTNPRIHAELFRQIDRVVPNNTQIWLSTHSVGVLLAARDASRLKPGTVAFLDFEREFDLPVTLVPTAANREFWQRSFDVAFSEMASLVAPEQLILCEGGSPKEAYERGYDAQVLNKIFGESRPEAKFISVGSSNDVKLSNKATAVGLVQAALGSKIIRLIDRDDHSESEISDLRSSGISVLCRRQIESYLFDEEILRKFCISQGQESLVDDVIMTWRSSISNLLSRGKPSDDVKSAVDDFYAKLKKVLSLTQSGGNAHSFARDKLAPLITGDTRVYKELEQAIFG